MFSDYYYYFSSQAVILQKKEEYINIYGHILYISMFIYIYIYIYIYSYIKNFYRVCFYDISKKNIVLHLKNKIFFILS